MALVSCVWSNRVVVLRLTSCRFGMKRTSPPSMEKYGEHFHMSLSVNVSSQLVIQSKLWNMKYWTIGNGLITLDFPFKSRVSRDSAQTSPGTTWLWMYLLSSACFHCDTFNTKGISQTFPKMLEAYHGLIEHIRIQYSKLNTDMEAYTETFTN